MTLRLGNQTATVLYQTPVDEILDYQQKLSDKWGVPFSEDEAKRLIELRTSAPLKTVIIKNIVAQKFCSLTPKREPRYRMHHEGDFYISSNGKLHSSLRLLSPNDLAIKKISQNVIPNIGKQFSFSTTKIFNMTHGSKT